MNDVGVGPGSGEGLPLAQAKRIDVRIALLRAAFSRGKDVAVRSAEIDGLDVNFVRLADGTTNLERLQKKLAETQPPEKKPPEEKKQSDLWGSMPLQKVSRRASWFDFIWTHGRRVPMSSTARSSSSGW